MFVEESVLCNDGGADEMVVDFVLRAGLHAAAAGHTFGDLVVCFLAWNVFLWPRPHVVGVVNGDPCLESFELFKDARTIDDEVSDNGVFGHGLQGNEVAVVGGVFVDEAGAGLSDGAVDEHSACAADFFEAGGIPDDGGGFSAVRCDGVCGDGLEAGDDVGAGVDGYVEFFVALGFAGAVLTFNSEADGSGGGCGF